MATAVPKKPTKVAKASKTAAPSKPVKAAPKGPKTVAHETRSPGRPKGTPNRIVQGIEVHKTFSFDRAGTPENETHGGYRRIVIEAGTEAAKALEKLTKMIEKKDKKLRDLLGY